MQAELELELELAELELVELAQAVDLKTWQAVDAWLSSLTGDSWAFLELT